MPPAGFEPTISAGERSQTYALDRAATETGSFFMVLIAIPGLPPIDCLEIGVLLLTDFLTFVSFPIKLI